MPVLAEYQPKARFPVGDSGRAHPNSFFQQAYAFTFSIRPTLSFVMTAFPG
jgi:hypothetical protein